MEDVFNYPPKKLFKEFDKNENEEKEDDFELKIETTYDGQIILKEFLTITQKEYLEVCKFSDVT